MYTFKLMFWQNRRHSVVEEDFFNRLPPKTVLTKVWSLYHSLIFHKVHVITAFLLTYVFANFADCQYSWRFLELDADH